MASGAVYQQLFTRVPSEHFHSPELAFEFLRLCRDSLPLFGRSLGVLKLSFPNLFKACSLVPRPGGVEGSRGGQGWGWCPGLSPPPQGLGQLFVVTAGPRAGDLEGRARARRGAGQAVPMSRANSLAVRQGLVLNLSGA